MFLCSNKKISILGTIIPPDSRISVLVLRSSQWLGNGKVSTKTGNPAQNSTTMAALQTVVNLPFLRRVFAFCQFLTVTEPVVRWAKTNIRLLEASKTLERWAPASWFFNATPQFELAIYPPSIYGALKFPINCHNSEGLLKLWQRRVVKIINLKKKFTKPNFTLNYSKIPTHTWKIFY